MTYKLCLTLIREIGFVAHFYQISDNISIYTVGLVQKKYSVLANTWSMLGLVNSNLATQIY